jgi:type II secretory pathway predicted ATPase ExeA
MTLQAILQQNKLSQAWLAQQCCMSTASMSLICKQGIFPKSLSRAAIVDAITAALKTKQIDLPENLFSPTTKEEIDMSILIRKQPLSQAVLRVYGIFQSPFTADVKEMTDVFIGTPDIMYAKEAMYQCARNNSFLAIVGESGSGKTTLREYLEERCLQEELNIVFVKPYIIGMEDNENKGKALKAGDIADNIIWALDAKATPKRSLQAKFRQMEIMLLEATSKTGGNKRVVIVLEEAHALNKWTLKQLKRFYEIKRGLANLLGILLIGQPELKSKLNENDPSVREVVQRCELVELSPLAGNIHGYLKAKFARIGKDANDIITADAIDYLNTRLTDNRDKKHQISMTYPLFINNIIAKAMCYVVDNAMIESNKPMAINKDVIEEVLK